MEAVEMRTLNKILCKEQVCHAVRVAVGHASIGHLSQRVDTALDEVPRRDL